MSVVYSRTKKTPFYTIKSRSLKSRKIDIFSKGFTHGFFLGNIGQENVKIEIFFVF